MADHRVITGDCREVLKPRDGISIRFDAIVTDPPYGIEYDAGRYPDSQKFGVMEGDTEDFDPRALLAYEVPTILWGANNYTTFLPRGGWLCWDKRCGEEADRIFGSPFELAWISDRQKFKMLRLQHTGCVNADGPGARVHPTQKPVGLMVWCMKLLGLKPGATVLDPYCGSGSTGMAAKLMGLNFIGIEKKPEWAEAARRRIADSASLFNQPEP